ncbi:MAG: hypothetical protein SOZ52_08840 [Pyramidobacter sp.]|nr:hypothetical protein [Pyramidobacter sp.]
MCIPYWDSELDVEVGCWGGFNFERGSISMAALHSASLGIISAQAMSLGSELLYLCGTGGVAGSMMWEESVLEVRNVPSEAPFTLVLGYSREMEKFASSFAADHEEIKAGVTDCTFWSNKVPLSRYKVIAFMATVPVFDERDCLADMARRLKEWKSRDPFIPFYAEKLGFIRAPLSYETDVPRDLVMTSELQNFQLEATRLVVGPSPSVALPLFYEMRMGAGDIKDCEEQ